jgi:hypothetical protein
MSRARSPPKTDAAIAGESAGAAFVPQGSIAFEKSHFFNGF